VIQYDSQRGSPIDHHHRNAKNENQKQGMHAEQQRGPREKKFEVMFMQPFQKGILQQIPKQRFGQSRLFVVLAKQNRFDSEIVVAMGIRRRIGSFMMVPVDRRPADRTAHDSETRKAQKEVMQPRRQREGPMRQISMKRDPHSENLQKKIDRDGKEPPMKITVKKSDAQGEMAEQINLTKISIVGHPSA
jgi:hypothetical protein